MFSFFWKKKTVDIKKERQNVSNLAIGIASITFFTLLAQIVVVNVLAIVAPSLIESSVAQMFISAITMYGIGMPLSMTYFNRCEVCTVKQNKIPLGSMSAVIVICFALTYIGSIIGTLVEELLATLMGKTATNPVEETVSSIPLWAVFLFMVILAPIFEEIFFRKIVIDRLRRYGDLPAMVISGIVFGVIHGNFSQFFYAALLGVVFGGVYLHTGKLRYTIFLHMLINFMGGFYTTLMLEKFGGEIPLEFTEEIIARYPTGYTMMTVYSAIYSICLWLAIPCLITLLTRLRLQKGPVTLRGAQSAKVVLLNLGFWLSALFLIGNFALSML